MSKKSILNLTSDKKRDTMLCYSNVTAANPYGSSTYTASPAILTGNVLHVFPWCATARGITSANGYDGAKVDEPIRTATTVFMRGLAERIRISTSDGLPWLWRRVCFASKNNAIRTYTTGTSTSYSPAIFTSSGYVRAVNQVASGTNFDDLIWKGTINKDWNDWITAPIDSRRVDVKYDRTVTIAGGNEEGTIREFSLWHPMNKNLVYDDDENGDEDGGNQWSVQDKRGMGDYWVVDIFSPRAGGASTSQLLFEPQASLYWHEK